MQMVMNPDETQIQIFTNTNWPMSHAKRVTKDNSKNPEYRGKKNADRRKLFRRKIMSQCVNSTSDLKRPTATKITSSKVISFLSVC